MFNEPVGCAFLVEDNPDDIAIFEYAARKLEFPITLRKHMTGTSALAEILDFSNRTEAQLPAIFILDVSLSDMQGDAVFDQISAAYGTLDLPQPPVVFLTSAETPAVVGRVAQTENARICRKPTSLEGYADIFREMFSLTTASSAIH
ncbi:MAG: hypothetical protein AAFY73_02605 [Pseudomonadota bacterium]